MVRRIFIFVSILILMTGCSGKGEVNGMKKVKSDNKSSVISSSDSSSTTPSNQSIVLSSLSQSDQNFVNYIENNTFPLVNTGEAGLRQIIDEINIRSQQGKVKLSPQEETGYTNALASAANQLAAPSTATL